MSDDWKPGDLAVCVTNVLPGYKPSRVLQTGKTYIVQSTYISRTCGILALVLDGVTPMRWPGFHHECFRKVRPDQHEPCEAEFVTLLNRTKRKVGA